MNHGPIKSCTSPLIVAQLNLYCCAERAKRIRIEWNNVSSVVDVAIMSVAISRDSSRVFSSSSKLYRPASLAHLMIEEIFTFLTIDETSRIVIVCCEPLSWPRSSSLRRTRVSMKFAKGVMGRLVAVNGGLLEEGGAGVKLE